MKIAILGAHNIESASTGGVSLLVDDVIAIDAGNLTSSLSFEAQMELKAVLLTHPHYDHLRDLPGLGMNISLQEGSLDVYAIEPVFQALEEHLMNDTLYPNYFRRPAGKPVLRRHDLDIGKETEAGGYKVLPVRMTHSVPAAGLLLTDRAGKKLFFTGDTGPGLTWEVVSPDLLIIETTALNRMEQFALDSGHLTPSLLEKELMAFRNSRGYLPRVVTVHMNPLDEAELRAELDIAGSNLGIRIESGCEGMCIEL